MNFYFLIILISFFLVNNGCRDLNERHAILYKLILSNAKSEQSIMTRRRVSSVSKCMNFAENKNALAFNYGNYILIYY